MVAVFLRLKLTQLSNAWRRTPQQLLGLVLLLAVAVLLTILLLSAFGGLSALTITITREGMVLLGSAVTLAFVAVPLFFDPDDPSDPRIFGFLGVAPGTIARGLFASAFLNIPSVILLVIAVAQIGVWDRYSDVALVSTLSAIAILVTGVLGGRLARSLGSVLFGGRRGREVAGGLGVFAALAMTPFVLVLILSERSAEVTGGVHSLAKALAASPLGFAWAAPAEAAAGNGESAWFKLLGALAVIAVLWLAWLALLNWMLRSPSRRGASIPVLGTPGGHGLGWFDWFPGTAVGVIAARSLSYWVRDGRYKLSLAVIPIVPIFVVIPFLFAGVWWQNLALIPLPVMCLFLGWLLHNDLAHDNTALWLHVASNISGRADRLGRVLPVLLLGLPLIGVLAPISASLYGDWSVLPSIIGVSVCVLLSGVGISSYVSVRMPYAAVRPGASPFAQPQSSASAAGQAISFIGTVLVTVPVLALAGLGLAFGGGWEWMALLGGTVLGLVVLWLGLTSGARVFERQAPELLAFTMRN